MIDGMGEKIIDKDSQVGVTNNKDISTHNPPPH